MSENPMAHKKPVADEKVTPRAVVRSAALLISTAFRANPRHALLVLGLAPAAGAITAVTAIGLQKMVDCAIAGDLFGMTIAAALMAGALVASYFTATLVAEVRNRLQQRVGLVLDQRIMTLCSTLPHLDHHENPAYQDRLDLLRSQRAGLGAAFGVLVENLRTLITFGFTVALLASVRPELLLLVLLAFPTVLAVRRGERATARAEEESTSAARLRRSLFALVCSPNAAKEVRVCGLQRELAERHRDLQEQVDGPKRRAEARTALWTCAGWTVFGLGFAGALYLVVAAVLRGQATAGDVVLTLSLGGQLTGNVSNMINMLSFLQKSVRSVGYYLWLDDHAKTAAKASAGSAVPPAQGEDLVLEHLSFGYPGVSRPILNDLSLRLPAGSTVAIVGENGAGKTTLVKLLCQMYQPTGGHITYGGRDITDYDLQAWRSRTTACFQDYLRPEFLLHESVGLGDLPRIGDLEAVGESLDRAGAAVIPDLLPKGLRTQLGATFPGGTDLSGGQWQKLAMARAGMRAAPLLRVLDEPAANLDPAAEYEIFKRFQETAAQSGEGTITVFVSHRFATVRSADLIVVLDDAQIREVGSHDELMAAEDLYATLYKLHAKGYQESALASPA
ncbi:ABC transporter ATP-binding protein [Planotetraspora sp. GP83]|uniref:ABC transporter ATP-binding protein n=1 Tax=Planotetraspora sp. GP83 TaxID=3156264 RepID=UPI003515AD2A